MEKKLHIRTTDKEVQRLRKRDKRLAKVIDYFGNIECNIHNDTYSFVVYEIIGQMLSDKVENFEETVAS